MLVLFFLDKTIALLLISYKSSDVFFPSSDCSNWKLWGLITLINKPILR